MDLPNLDKMSNPTENHIESQEFDMLVKQKEELLKQLAIIISKIRSICKHTNRTEYEHWIDNFRDVYYEYVCNDCGYQWQT